MPGNGDDLPSTSSAKRKENLAALNRLLKGAPKEDKPRFNLASRRLNEIVSLISLRYGDTIPDTDGARLAVRLLCEHLARLPREAIKIVTNRISELAPWMSETERSAMVQKATKRPQTYKAKRLGRLLELTYAERRYLQITTIKAIDQPSKKDVDRERWHLRHAKKGGVSRAEYLAQFTTSAELTRPWETLGISRNTYYRRLQSVRETNLTLGPSAALLPTGDEQPSVTKSLTRGAKPWLALGISRSTYYRRRASGDVGAGDHRVAKQTGHIFSGPPNYLPTRASAVGGFRADRGITAPN